MATQSPATIARRAARKAVIAHYAAAGIRLEESQARFIWSINMPTAEYVALRTAFGLGEAHKPVVSARTARKALPRAAAPAPKVFVSTDYRSHIVEPGKGGDSAWVSTDGTFYSVSYAGHSEFASKCAKAGVVRSTEFGSYVPSLERKGWVHISGYTVVNEAVRNTLTAEQASTLMAWAGTSDRADRAVRRVLAPQQ